MNRMKSRFLPAGGSLLALWGIVVGAVMLSLSFPAIADSPEEVLNSDWYKHREAVKDERMAWWRDARFGMFIHWGVYAVPAGTYDGKQISGIGEWIMNRAKIPVATYKAYAKDFNPVKYDPQAWVQMAKNAGMKYIVITSKHHDGFALFDSKVSDWNVVKATPYGKDLLKPLAAAAHAAGMKIGFYYSQAQDWNNPGGAKSGYKEGEYWDPAQAGDFDHYLETVAAPQVEEIFSNYDIDILWWDTPTWMTPERAAKLEVLLKDKPMLIVNNRLGGGFEGDTDTPEQHIPATGIPGRDWEVCMTMNDTWGFKSYDDNWKSVQDLIQKLCDIASKGGNFLLNVGPTKEGLIPQPSIERLKAVGDWMDVNGDAIYETSPSPFRKLTWGRCTTKTAKNGTALYLMVFDWPADGKLVLPGLQTEVKGARLLAGKQKLEFAREGDNVVIQVPASAPDPNASVIRVALAGAPVVAETLPAPDASGIVVLPAVLADMHNQLGTNVHLEGSEVQNIGWWTDSRAHVSWAFNVKETGTYAVSAEVACEKASALTVSLGVDKKSAAIAATGGYKSYKTVSLGEFSIKQPGEQEIALTPVRNGWNPVNVRGLTVKKLN